jgi:hypothetical protein
MKMKMSVMGTPTGKPVPLATDRPTKKPSSKPFLASTTKPASQSSVGGMKLGGMKLGGMGMGNVPPGPMDLKKGSKHTPNPAAMKNIHGKGDGVVTANKAKLDHLPAPTKGMKGLKEPKGKEPQHVGNVQFVGALFPPNNSFASGSALTPFSAAPNAGKGQSLSMMSHESTPKMVVTGAKHLPFMSSGDNKSTIDGYRSILVALACVLGVLSIVLWTSHRTYIGKWRPQKKRERVHSIYLE